MSIVLNNMDVATLQRQIGVHLIGLPLVHTQSNERCEKDAG